MFLCFVFLFSFLQLMFVSRSVDVAASDTSSYVAEDQLCSWNTPSVPNVSSLPAEVRLQVEELESNVSVPESASIRLGCSIPSQSSRDSRFSVSWYVQRSDGDDGGDDDQPEEGTERECVFSIGHDAIFGNGNCSPREEAGPNSRLRFERTTSDQYSLTIQGARPADTGRYYCHVEEWLLNPRNAWYRLATNNSGFTIVNVLQQGTFPAVCRGYPPV